MFGRKKMNLTPKHPLKKQSLPDLIYEKLKGDIAAKRRKGALPGSRTLASEFGVARKSVIAAIDRLREEGLLQANGPRKMTIRGGSRTRSERVYNVAIITATPFEDMRPSEQLFLVSLMREIEAAGYSCEMPVMPVEDKEENLEKIARWLKKQHADIFLPHEFNRKTLELFASQPVPMFAFGGQVLKLPIAGCGCQIHDAAEECFRELKKLGHSRIVLALPANYRNPEARLARLLREIFGVTESGIHSYALPEWEDTPEGLHALLKELFRVTPPTALVLQSGVHARAAITFLSKQGLRVPEDVSVITIDYDSTLHWQFPECTFSRIDSGNEAMIRQCMKWLRAVQSGKIPAPAFQIIPGPFVPGNSIGPAKR